MDANAIVHTHAPFATTLACHSRGIPAFHYMVAVAGGRDIRCAPYATFGTQALSDHVVAALDGRRACLLAHHGMIAVGALAARGARARGRDRDARRDLLARAVDRGASSCSPTPRWTSCSRSSRATGSHVGSRSDGSLAARRANDLARTTVGYTERSRRPESLPCPIRCPLPKPATPRSASCRRSPIATASSPERPAPERP